MRPPSVNAPDGADPALAAAGVWLVIPCYRVVDHILTVIARAPPWVEGIVCVDDACPAGSGDFIAANNTDPRVRLLRLAENQGVGGATLAGYEEAARLGGRILVKVDGDDQMDLT
ncbi:MAG TPA: glycosyltransferase, partial [Phenylobacterium sp.]|nr:glycosyltransferase [Phenylobacterium sp.]